MNARSVVTHRIAEQARQFPKLILTPLDVAGLDSRDSGLALAIEHAVLRRWLTLRAVIESQLERPWDETETKLQAALLVGAAQLLLLDRLPDHAVINETVQWVKEHHRAKAGGFANAVLRKVAGLRLEILPSGGPPSPSTSPIEWPRDVLPLHDGRVWKLAQPVFDENPHRRLAQQTSHPDELITHWLRVHGPEEASKLAAHSLIHAPIVVHSVDSDSAAAAGSLPDGMEPHESPGFFVFTGERENLGYLLAKRADLIVQDVTSAGAVLATRDLSPPPALIIDACAGKGTKTRQLAAMHPAATIIASDTDSSRLSVLREVFQNHDRVRVVPHDGLGEFRNQADLVLLDVPCSNLGVLARRVEAKYRFSAATLQSVIGMQKQIIADSLSLLTPAGRLLYSTCSTDPSENIQQVQWITKWHKFRVIASESHLPRGVPGDSIARYADGGFHALLQRTSS